MDSENEGMGPFKRSFDRVGILYVAAQIFQMNNLIWLFENSFSMLIIVLVIVFQPEFRKALEQLGNQKVISGIVPFDNSKDNRNVSARRRSMRS